MVTKISFNYLILMYQRIIEGKIRERLFQGKIICLFGPRRSGKTTLAKKILADFGDDGYYMNCENIHERAYLLSGEPDVLKKYLGSKKIVVIDEAQTVEHIGTVLKVFVDTYPEVQIIATGSSSFELANRVGEPLVGRSWDFFLAPLSFKEIFEGKGLYEIQKSFEDILIYGSFPSVVSSGTEDKVPALSQIANNYLYKDIFAYEQIRKPKILEDLLHLLAFQIGNEVNTSELSKKLEIGRPTVERYLQLLEKTFVIKRLYSLKRNRRDEIRSAFKVYFYDNGVRNYLINSFNNLKLRNDIGALFENYFVMERIKYHQQKTGLLPIIYFWRTHSQLEIDYIEEKDGVFRAFECKWSEEKAGFTEFQKAYPNSETFVVNSKNIQDFLL